MKRLCRKTVGQLSPSQLFNPTQGGRIRARREAGLPRCLFGEWSTHKSTVQKTIHPRLPTGEGSSRDGMSEIDASDVPPVHVEVEPDSMPTRILVVRRAFEREGERS